MKIMFCYDASYEAKDALDKCLELFSCQMPEIILLTVVEGPLDASMENEDIFEKLSKDVHDKHREVAKSITKKGFDVDAMTATGDPRTMIVEAVKSKSPDIVVIGRRGRSTVKDMVIGSVSAYVVRHVPCPVMVMPRKG